MTPEHDLLLRSWISGGAAVVFAVGALVLLARLVDRYRRHKLLSGGEVPRALLRDMATWIVLVVLLIVPAIWLFLGQTAGDFLWWIITRTVLGLIWLGIWLWYEFRVVPYRGSENDYENGSHIDH